MKSCPHDSDKEDPTKQSVSMNESRLQQATKNHFLEKRRKE